MMHTFHSKFLFVLFFTIIILSSIPAALAQCTPSVPATPGDDAIACNGNGGAATVINADAGDDVIVNNGQALSIDGQDDDDMIINNGRVDFDIQGGDGDDVIIHNGSLGNGGINSGDGDDLIYSNGSYDANDVSAGAGDDTVILQNGTDGGATIFLLRMAVRG